ncbi:hypothetical protein [Cylindrospermopsis raciborskii]|nr:hypothetical protein [Cylindrospermopsis raciborskii]
MPKNAQEQEAQTIHTPQRVTQLRHIDFYQWVQTTIDNIQLHHNRSPHLP